MATPRVAATVILYNPEDEIALNIASYVELVETLYVVDNSTHHNKNLIEDITNKYTNVEYINNNDNLGIATALNIACDKAIEDGFEWILTMDQDSQFINFEHYLQCFYKVANDDVAITAVHATWHPEAVQQQGSCEYEEKNLVITSGNLLNLNLFKQIGGFEDKLFIDMVDHDYCLKARSLGYKILYFPNVLLKHSLGNLFKRKNLITGKIRNKIEHSPQRVYYITRNFFYVWRQHHKKFPQEFNLLKTLNILFIHEVTKILLYEDQKWAKIKAKFLGFTHFLLGKYGKISL